MKIIKLFLLLTFLLLASTSFASLNREEVVNVLKGRYAVQFPDIGGFHDFVIHSNGEAELLSDEQEIGSISLSIDFSTSSFGIDGLPVVHLILSWGSDEQAQDYHLFLTVFEDGNTPLKIKLLNSFYTYNDGPNGYTFAEALNGVFLQKYDAKTKAMVTVL